MITSNLPFSKWEKIFKDPMTTAAAIDRLVHHSIILELNIKSYRTEKVIFQWHRHHHQLIVVVSLVSRHIWFFRANIVKIINEVYNSSEPLQLLKVDYWTFSTDSTTEFTFILERSEKMQGQRFVMHCINFLYQFFHFSVKITFKQFVLNRTILFKFVLGKAFCNLISYFTKVF